MKALTGKRYFYRLGFRHGFRRLPNPEIKTWPLWAVDAFVDGKHHGIQQRSIALCPAHEPLDNRNHREVAFCVHCGMRMRAKRRGAA